MSLTSKLHSKLRSILHGSLSKHPLFAAVAAVTGEKLLINATDTLLINATDELEIN